jgi:acetyl esterase/lipase
VELIVENTAYDGPHGPVPVRTYRSPAAADAAPALVWCHGGGWIGGDLDMQEADGVARVVAESLPGVVVSVEYRLAPGHLFPAPVDDVLAAFAGTHRAADALGVDRRRIALGGASAGAHLCALAAARLRAEDAAVDRPVALVLVYPATDPVDGPYDPRPVECPQEYWLGRTVTTSLFSNLLGPDVDVAADGAPDDAVPARVAVEGLPPTLITTAGIDGLTAQAVAYVAQLESAGVDVTHHDQPRLYHGYLSNVGTSRGADAALARHVDWLRSALAV